MESFATNLQNLSVQFVPFMMAVVFHEFAHGFIANRFGDSTAKAAGRLTLNPIPHIDPLGTLIFPLVNMLTGMNLLFGWARPVPINPSRFSNVRRGLFWVSLAGPLMNFILAILASIMFCSIVTWMPESFFLYDPLTRMSLVAVSLNYALGIFNLIPLPPLDGSKVVESFLPYEAAKKYESIAQYSFFILMALLLTGALNILSYPIHFCTRVTISLMAQLFNIPGI